MADIEVDFWKTVIESAHLQAIHDGKPRDKPLIFCPAMVKALISGQKTQTRRLGGNWQAGDTFWVREKCMKALIPVGLAGAPQIIRGPLCEDKPGWQWGVWFEDSPDPGGWPIRLGWKPSIHMFKWAARIRREVVAVRREPLQCITEEDAIAEGIERIDSERGWNRFCFLHDGCWYNFRTATEAYAALWNILHPSVPFASNPTVIVLTFADTSASNFADTSASKEIE